jgi:nuclear GTP-binding protein
MLPALFRVQFSTQCSSISGSAAVLQVHLDKHIKLLDSPGIVFSAGASAAAAALRNCIKVAHRLRFGNRHAPS